MNEIYVKRLFRVLVVFAAIFYTYVWVTPYIGHWWLSNDEVTLLVLAGYGAYFPFIPGLHWSILIAWLLVFLGLFFFNRVARIAFIITILAELVETLLTGYWILSPLNGVILSLTNILNGAILVMMYCTPMSRFFEKKAD